MPDAKMSDTKSYQAAEEAQDQQERSQHLQTRCARFCVGIIQVLKESQDTVDPHETSIGCYYKEMITIL